MSALEQVLAAVQQRLQHERRAACARQAAWGSLMVALLAVIMHLWVRPVGTTGMLAAVALPWLLAALQCVATRPGRAQCAQWADQHLAGQSGFVTRQELTGPQAAAQPAAIAHLEAWLDRAAREALARLHEMPRTTSLAKPLAAALVCASLAVVLLQIPTQPLAAPRAASQVASMADTDRPESISRPGSRPPDVASVKRTLAENAVGLGTERDISSGAPTAVQPSQQHADSLDDATMQPGEPPAGTRTAARAPATGREAGDSADPGGDAALVAPWQEALAARLREIATTQTPPAGRAEPTEVAEYTTAADPYELPGGIPPQAAAAEPPPAASSLTLGPAEQAYVRAYSADTGAKR